MPACSLMSAGSALQGNQSNSIAIAAQASASGGRDSLELMVWKTMAEMPPGGPQGVVKLIFRIIHLIHPEYGSEAALVEPGIVRHKRKSLNQRLYLFPDIREYGSVLCVLGAKSMNPHAEPLVIFRFRMDQAVEPVGDLTVTHHNDPDTAHAGRALVRRLEIYRRKISHIFPMLFAGLP